MACDCPRTGQGFNGMSDLSQELDRKQLKVQDEPEQETD